MPRNMSFMLTTEQIKAGKKNVTRRLGWWFLKPGDLLWACKKCMGLKKGEKVEHLRLIRVLETNSERLEEIIERPRRLKYCDVTETEREGFPEQAH